MLRQQFSRPNGNSVVRIIVMVLPPTSKSAIAAVLPASSARHRLQTSFRPCGPAVSAADKLDEFLGFFRVLRAGENTNRFVRVPAKLRWHRTGYTEFCLGHQLRQRPDAEIDFARNQRRCWVRY